MLYWTVLKGRVIRGAGRERERPAAKGIGQIRTLAVRPQPTWYAHSSGELPGYPVCRVFWRLMETRSRVVIITKGSKFSWSSVSDFCEAFSTLSLSEVLIVETSFSIKSITFYKASHPLCVIASHKAVCRTGSKEGDKQEMRSNKDLWWEKTSFVRSFLLKAGCVWVFFLLLLRERDTHTLHYLTPMLFRLKQLGKISTTQEIPLFFSFFFFGKREVLTLNIYIAAFCLEQLGKISITQEIPKGCIYCTPRTLLHSGLC